MENDKKQVYIYDSTLRDGAQAEGISFSVEDKLRIVDRLDKLGVTYIEAGNPGSNPKDLEFFSRVRKMKLSGIKLAAFGSTRRVGISVEEDNNIQSLLLADTPTVAIFGKMWDLHVTDILRTSLDENLRMIEDTLRFLKQKGKEVVFDAEHFFDGYKANRAYALQALQAAVNGGADCLVLCDTNGGCFPMEIFEITRVVCDTFQIPVGIHCHNDTGMAVANSIIAVQAGAVHVQGTFNGFGERCGNANLCTIVPNLQIKLGISCIPDEQMQKLTSAARYVSELANVSHDERAPYVGSSSFAHKGGMHIDGVNKNPVTFEHINPKLVGNERRFLTSEVSGRSTILASINEVDPAITKDSPETKQIIDRLKELEHSGYQFEGAESSFELVIRKVLGKYKPFFELDQFKVIISEPSGDNYSSSAMIKVNVDGEEEITAAEGDGPVNAMDKALRKALERFYPQLKGTRLVDFKVRVLDSKSATAAKVRVLIQTTDGENVWSTVGVSTDIIEASWRALVDSIEYRLLQDQ